MNPNADIKILVVDDTRTIRFHLASILTKNGYTVIEADSGEMALKQIFNERPQIVLMDVVMPEMDGIECCNIIKKNPMYEDIRIIMVTSEADYEKTNLAYKAGCNDYLTKPIVEDDLLDKIFEIVRIIRITQCTKEVLTHQSEIPPKPQKL